MQGLTPASLFWPQVHAVCLQEPWVRYKVYGSLSRLIVKHQTESKLTVVYLTNASSWTPVTGLSTLRCLRDFSISPPGALEDRSYQAALGACLGATKVDP